MLFTGTSFLFPEKPQREERYDYPLDAIREIVLNMIVHRDYRDSSDSVIKIFDDRIEFFNPGELYDNLTIKQLMSNNYESKTRNKLISSMFKECGLIEKYGSGIARIKKLCKAHGIKAPKYEEIQNDFRVTIYKTKSNEGINELYKYIQDNPLKRVSQIEKDLKIPAKTLERWIKTLRNKNKIEFQGSKKTGGYRAIIHRTNS